MLKPMIIGVWVLVFVGGFLTVLWQCRLLDDDQNIVPILTAWTFCYLPYIVSVITASGRAGASGGGRTLTGLLMVGTTLVWNGATIFFLWRFFFFLPPIHPSPEEGFIRPLESFAARFATFPVLLLIYSLGREESPQSLKH